MKKAFALIILCALILRSGPAFARSESRESMRRCLFVSVIQEPPVLQSREAIGKLVDFAKKADVGTLFVQVYYANRAWFQSKVGDPQPYEACLKCVGEDPLALLIKEAHAAGIEVHAWLNILSLSSNCDAFLLKKYGAGILTRNRTIKRALEDYKIDSQYFLEPGDPRVREELETMVGEVVADYPGLDGIQFDYIRYPDTRPAYGYTKTNIERYKKAAGCETVGECDKAWKDWKRAQVTELLGLLINRARAVRPGIRVSATGCMPYARAYDEAFQDWPSWLDRGLIDFVTIMVYSPCPDTFVRWITQAKGRVRDFRKVNIGLGAYKLVRSAGIFMRELEICQDIGSGGCVIFHYGSLLEDPELAAVLTKEREP